MSNNSNRMIVFASILGAILATSILALNPSTITNAQAMPYGSGDYYDDRYSYYGDQYGYDSNYYYQDDNRYGYDSNYYYQDDNRYGYDSNYYYDDSYYKDDKKYGYDYKDKKKDVNIQKIKCINSNINVNGIEITEIPQDGMATAEAANEQEGLEGANGNDDGWNNLLNIEKNLVNICINVNKNEQVKISQPEATLSVSKTVSCQASGPGLQRICNEITNGTVNPAFQITPDEFTIQVTGNNPNPSSFDGSTTPVLVTLGAGDYEVTETEKATVQATIIAIETANPFANVSGPFPTFTGDCTQVGVTDTATGTIAAGESQTCNKNNGFTVGPEANG